jgi:hypothetical protein
MEKQNNSNYLFIATFFVALLLLFQNCKYDTNKELMPKRFKTDSLECCKEMFSELKTSSGSEDGFPYIEIKSRDCTIIPFCGILRIIEDTIFFASSRNSKGVPFLMLNINKYTSWEVEYSPSQSDSICYLGRVYDGRLNDSLMMFWLQPQKRNAPSDASYLKYLLVDNLGVFKYFTFSGSAGDQTISLEEFPKVVYSSKNL